MLRVGVPRSTQLAARLIPDGHGLAVSVGKVEPVFRVGGTPEGGGAWRALRTLATREPLAPRQLYRGEAPSGLQPRLLTFCACSL